MKPAPFDCQAPATLREAISLLTSHPKATVIAGGQSLMPVLAFRLAMPSMLVDLRRVPGLGGITIKDDGVRLGALVRWLIKLLVRAHDLKEKLRPSPATRIADQAMREKLSPSDVAPLLRSTFLAPDITRATLEGRQPSGVIAQKLVTYSGLPFAWSEQRRALGFT